MGSELRRFSVEELIANRKLVIGDGYRAKNEELSANGIPFARAGNINDGFRFDGADCFPRENLFRVGNKISEPGDVVFTSKGTVGRFALVQKRTPQFVYSPQLCFWRACDLDLIDPQFLYFWMNGREFYSQYKGVAGQTDMAEYVSLTDQRRMHISLPTISKQHRIAHILGTLDDKIELNRRTNETLEAMARAIFKSWFVDFDPVKAKAAGKKPFGMDDETEAMFPSEFEDSELGPIPKGWRVGSLWDISDLNPDNWSRVSLPKKIEYLDLSNVKWGRIEGLVAYMNANAPSRAQRKLKTGDSIIGTVRPGNGSYCLIAEDGITGSSGFACLRPKRNSMREIVYLASTSQDNIERLSHLADGGAYPAVRPEVVFATQVCLPQKSVLLEKFSAEIANILDQIALFELKSTTLAQTRDLLLPKLLSGEIEVGEK